MLAQQKMLIKLPNIAELEQKFYDFVTQSLSEVSEFRSVLKIPSQACNQVAFYFAQENRRTPNGHCHSHEFSSQFAHRLTLMEQNHGFYSAHKQ